MSAQSSRHIRSILRQANRTPRKHVVSRFIHTSRPLHQQSQSNLFVENVDEDTLGPRKERLPVNLGIVIVPQQKAFVVERFGRFTKILEPGLNFLVPLIDSVSYVHTLKEEAIMMTKQHAITRDNVTIEIDGVLYLRIVDPYKASYGVSDPLYAVTQLAQTTMRSELGKMTLDKTFEERENLNVNIVSSLNDATDDWGVVCLRYEIRDIKPPATVRQAMEMQAEAERKKRAHILDSEAEQQSAVNLATGQQQARILEAEGEAKSITLRAEATATAIQNIGNAIGKKNGAHAVSLRVAEQYVEAFSNIAKEGNTMLLPSNPGDPASMVAQALSIFKTVNTTNDLKTVEDTGDDELFTPADGR